MSRIFSIRWLMMAIFYSLHKFIWLKGTSKVQLNLKRNRYLWKQWNYFAAAAAAAAFRTICPTLRTFCRSQSWHSRCTSVIFFFSVQTLLSVLPIDSQSSRWSSSFLLLKLTRVGFCYLWAEKTNGINTFHTIMFYVFVNYFEIIFQNPLTYTQSNKFLF